jgi:LacI family transcriptional regulator
MKVVNEHGFVPSVAATILRGGRTQLIGVLAPPLTSPFVPEIMLGVAEVTDRTEYEVVLYMMSPARKHSDVLDRILAMKLSTGLLAIMPGELGSHLDDLSRQGVPVVTIEDQVAPANTPWIGIDNLKAAYEATRYLLSLGHRRIGHIWGPRDYLCSRERYAGYRQALREAGLEVDPDLVWQGDFTIPGGRSCAHQLFELPPEKRPTALFTANDQTAFGVMDVAPQYGANVPDDLTLMGFDDMPMTAFTRPGLTTIRQPHREMGVLACELLLSMIDPQKHPFPSHHAAQENAAQDDLQAETNASLAFLELEDGDSKNKRFLLPTRLIARESCKAAHPVSHQL